ncbi:hypothetical protein HN011_005859 [Eciton burchellii]|nr:hypothetical protein HN011_005859 [Eciton burchellii]
MDGSKSEPGKNGAAQQECAGCGKAITERYLLKALDMYWHEDCLKCGCCDCRLGEVGSTLYTKANLILCKRDYLRLFGNTGHCAACSKVIPAFEMVMRARTNVYHLECFACQQCNHRRGLTEVDGISPYLMSLLDIWPTFLARLSALDRLGSETAKAVHPLEATCKFHVCLRLRLTYRRRTIGETYYSTSRDADSRDAIK